MARFSLEVGFSTDVGRQRKRNEDSYGVFVPFPGEGNPSQLAGLMLVADGMGGERAGDRASQLTAERLRHWFSTGAYCTWPEHSGEKPLEAALIHAIREVSNEIFSLGESDPAIRGLGSTVVIGAMTARQLVVAHVGDSRAYLVRQSSIRQLTSDHSWVQRQVDAGVITSEAARSHPQRNILTRSLGDSLPPEVDALTLDLQDGDLFILCSDGLTGGLTDSELLELCGQVRDPQPLAEALVRLANDQDGSDNITAVVGRCLEDDDDKRRQLEENTTSRIVIGGSDFYDGDTEIDIERPARNELEDEEFPVEPPSWKTWVAAALVALALGLLAVYLVQQSLGSSLDDGEQETPAVADYPQGRVSALPVLSSLEQPVLSNLKEESGFDESGRTLLGSSISGSARPVIDLG